MIACMRLHVKNAVEYVLYIVYGTGMTSQQNLTLNVCAINLSGPSSVDQFQVYIASQLYAISLHTRLYTKPA